ncbi:MAG: type II toxin-antitoxin system RelE/ParE family toxin [Verrucomicrobiales bacterium]
MIISETPAFTKAALDLIGEESLFELKVHLLKQPESGDLIPGHKGLRKIRWAASGRGKRGGSRVIYYYQRQPAEINLLAIYAKNGMTDLSDKTYRQLKKNLKGK